LGITILVVGFCFVVWHLLNKKPVFPNTMKKWECFLAKVVHGCLLAFFVIEPLLGLLMASFAGRPIQVWNWFSLILPVTLNKNVAAILAEAHVVLGWTFIVLIGIHLLAVLKHAIINHDSVIKRMM
jgi:cytochrome b561